MTYSYDRSRKVAEGGLANLVDAYLLNIAEKIAHGLATATHAHASGAKLNESKHEAETEVIARAGDMLHHFRVTVSCDSDLQVVAILDYASMGPHGEKGRERSLAFDLSSKAGPASFVSQIIDAALEQYQGVATRPVVDMRQANGRSARRTTKLA